MIPELTFVSLGWMAVVVSIGAVVRLDPGTRVLSAIVAAVMWFVWGAAAAEVGVSTGANSLQAVSLGALTYLGYVLAAVLTLVAIYQTVSSIRNSDTEMSDMDTGNL